MFAKATLNDNEFVKQQRLATSIAQNMSDMFLFEDPVFENPGL